MKVTTRNISCKNVNAKKNRKWSLHPNTSVIKYFTNTVVRVQSYLRLDDYELIQTKTPQFGITAYRVNEASFCVATDNNRFHSNRPPICTTILSPAGATNLSREAIFTTQSSGSKSPSVNTWPETPAIISYQTTERTQLPLTDQCMLYNSNTNFLSN